MLEYKGYQGVVEFDCEADIFFGEVVGLRDVITFEGKSVEELEQSFRDSVDQYLKFCHELGRSPEKPFSDKFNLRFPPDLHRAIAVKAKQESKSLNQWASETGNGSGSGALTLPVIPGKETQMGAPLKPARAVSPGRIIHRELETRGWSQRDLAVIMGRPYQAVNEIVRGVKRITPETARELAQAFGTSPEFWMNLETNYRLRMVAQEDKEQEIARRSRLYSIEPVAELIRRGQISITGNLDDLEKQACAVLGISSLDDLPTGV